MTLRKEGYDFIMEIRIAEQVNPVFECLDILMRHFSGHTYAMLKKELKSRLDIRVPEVEALLDFLQEIASQVTKGIRIDDEAAAFLFRPLGRQESTPAEAILQFYGDFSEQDPLTIRDGVLSMFREDPFRFLYSTLDNYNLLNLGTGKKAVKPQNLLQLMETCSLTDQEKWRLLTFYHDFALYLSRFIDVLREAIDAFSPLLPALSVWTEPFYSRFMQEINKETLYRHMAQKMQLILPETDRILIQPSLFGCCRLQYLAAEPGKCSNILWGMHFETIFSNRLQQNSSAYLCNNLKLLGDKSKFDILTLLSQRRYYSGELAKKLNLSTGTIAYHMQALLNAHFVTVDKRSYRTYYELNREEVLDFLAQVRSQLLAE